MDQSLLNRDPLGSFAVSMEHWLLICCSDHITSGGPTQSSKYIQYIYILLHLNKAASLDSEILILVIIGCMCKEISFNTQD
jgi:hypothetical protein